MAVMRASELEVALNTLMARRRGGEIPITDFYRGLLELSRDVIDSLLGELDAGMDEELVLEQIPALLVILREQIEGLKHRGG